MRIEFLNLKKINQHIYSEIQKEINDVLESGWYLLGNKTLEFEKNLKEYLIGTEEGYAYGCNSGTDAIVISLIAGGVTNGDEVITVSHTAIPTISAICSIGAIPVFVDIDENTWVMNPDLLKDAVTAKTKAIVAVHLYGNMVDIFRLKEILKEINREDIIVIEDVAQAHGSSLNNCQAGTIGDFGTYSFYPSKNIGALGDGGAVFCKKKEFGDRIKALRFYGQKSRYNAEVSGGINSRLDEMQAGILNIKLAYLDQYNKNKLNGFNNYKKELSNVPVVFQTMTDKCIPGIHLCVLKLENEEARDCFMLYLKEKEIETLIHYPIPNHKQKAFEKYANGKLDKTEQLANRIVSIPLNNAIEGSEYIQIISIIKGFFNKEN